MTERIGVAISTTGDEHRLGFLETCVKHWCNVSDDIRVFVTVDGSPQSAQRVAKTLYYTRADVYRVGVAYDPTRERDGRLGVAVNKNTGLELLMDVCVGASYPTIEHLFLCDDDTWPRDERAVQLHVENTLKHSMVCWGRGRLEGSLGAQAWWKWPRGVMLYTHRSVIAKVGGMDERFGPGGHEHAEWSRRIHQAGLTPVPFGSPVQYAKGSMVGSAMGAYDFWNCEDMPRVGESTLSHRDRKRGQTSIRRTSADWPAIEKIMTERDGDTSFVSFRAAPNGRGPATLCSDLPGQGV